MSAVKSFLPLCGVMVWAFVASVHSQTWSLLWSDEFNTPGPIDASRWRFETGTGTNGWGNNELQYYTDRAENAYVRNGNLEITVRRQDTAGRRFTSARLITLGTFGFQYGKVEARIKVITGKGMWPAFWMMGESFPTVGWPGCGEIDIMEVMDRGGPLDSRIALATAHWRYDPNGTHASYGLSDTALSALADSFHVYGLTWDRQYLRAFRDGRQYWVMDITPAHCSEFHQPFFLLLNAAVGGTPLGITDAAAVTAPLPQTMLVDYIRVYQDATETVPSANGRRPEEPPRAFLCGRQVRIIVPVSAARYGHDPTLSVYTESGRLAARSRSVHIGTRCYTFECDTRLPRGVYVAAVDGGVRRMLIVLVRQ